MKKVILVLILLSVLLTNGCGIQKLSEAEASLDPSKCEEITGLLKKSMTVDCYKDIGMKLADPSICEKITDEHSVYVTTKLYCKAVASRNVSNCDSVPGWRKDRCIAVLTKNVSYCDSHAENPKACRDTVERLMPYIK